MTPPTQTPVSTPASHSAEISQSVHTRGVSAQITPTSATRALLLAAMLTDLLLALAVFFGALWIFGLPPFLRWKPLLALVTWLTAYFGTQRAIRGITLGQWSWNLEVSRDRDRLLDLAAGAKLRTRMSGILLTVFAAAAFTTAFWGGTLSHPLWSSARERKYEAALPVGPEWLVSPYYYTLGAWPVRFEGKSVFLELPYNPGPPKVFAGKIIARWSTPNITLTYEGPKTPSELAALPQSRSQVKACLTGQSPIFSCAGIRSAALSRHIEEMSRLGARRETVRHWELRWITVDHPTSHAELPASEKPQGFYLSACSAHACEDRFVLISPKGMHQTFILHAEAQADGALLAPGPRRVQWLTARETFEKSLRSLRVSDDLSYGRAWIDRQIQDTRLRDVIAQPDRAAVVQKLAETESVLLSKISVEPAVYESYYYLAQLGLTLGRLAGRDTQASSTEDWPSVARPLVMTATRYAKDVSPQDKRNAELDAIAAEAQKY